MLGRRVEVGVLVPKMVVVLEAIFRYYAGRGPHLKVLEQREPLSSFSRPEKYGFVVGRRECSRNDGEIQKEQSFFIQRVSDPAPKTSNGCNTGRRQKGEMAESLEEGAISL